MWIGSLSLAGIPFFAGFYSKDSILAAAWASGTAVGRYSFCLGIFTAFLTAFYSWRLIIMTFHGPRGPTMRSSTTSTKAVGHAPAALCAGGRRDRSRLPRRQFLRRRRPRRVLESAILVLPQHDAIAARSTIRY